MSLLRTRKKKKILMSSFDEVSRSKMSIHTNVIVSREIISAHLNQILFTIVFMIISSEIFLASHATAPTIDYSHNMRILKLPKSACQVGDLIYRLKGSDADPNTQLTFGVSGIEARALLDVVPVAKSWNEADVYLRSALGDNPYNFSVYVSDGNHTTQVQSTILPMDDSSLSYEHSYLTNSLKNQSKFESVIGIHRPVNWNQRYSPFLNSKHVFNVPENTEPSESIGTISVLDSQVSDLPVRFELRGKNSERFNIKYVFGPRGQSHAELILAQKLDYESQNLYDLKIIALNAWTDVRVDTRNVATMDIVVTVTDLQDSPPVFKNLPQWLKLPNTMQVNDSVAKIEAEDSDYANQRPVYFALDANSPLSSYFDIHKRTGEIRLIKPIAELAMHSAWDTKGWSYLTVFASEATDTSSYDHLWPPMYSRAEIPLMLVDVINEPPKIIGGWQTSSGDPRQSAKTLHGYLIETDGDHSNFEASHLQPLQQVHWYTNSSDLDTIDKSVKASEVNKLSTGRPIVQDLGLGPNGTFELTLEGPDSHLFQIEPSFAVSRQSLFSVSVSPNVNKSLFDLEASPGFNRQFTFYLVATDFGSPQRLATRIRCLIELLDKNDNAPQFESDLYTFNIYENAQLGQPVGSVHAKDKDTIHNIASGIRVRYVSLSGHESHLFRLNEETGIITLAAHLDRERRASYLFLVEARDSWSPTARSNFTQVLINVMDVNDNAPVFLQSHYDAVLLADGTFQQPLVVRAVDPDETETANGQVAYEIVAGNANDLFSIDTVSGVIYPTGHLSSNPSDAYTSGYYPTPKPHPPQIPSILKEPILPYGSSSDSSGDSRDPHIQSPDPTGKISSSHEVEETTASSPKRKQPSNSIGGTLTDYLSSKLGWPRSEDQVNSTRSSDDDLKVTDLAHSYTNPVMATTSPPRSGRLSVSQVDSEQLPALDLLLNLESEQNYRHIEERSLNSRSPLGSGIDLIKLPPVTTLVVRAHDFGIPLRSSTVKVNIYNQALQSRSVSVILNGTADQLELKREAIERALSSITGTKATIESIDALSETSTISVARVKMAAPQHSLVDLTDLSGLMSAIDYHNPQVNNDIQQQFRHPMTHYYANGDKLVPATNTMSSNITSAGVNTNNLYSDIHTYALEQTTGLERRLLIYIIIVAICILLLIIIWMIYSCSHESDQVKLVDTNFIRSNEPMIAIDNLRSTGNNTINTLGKTTYAKSTADAATGTSNGVNSAIGNNLAKSRAIKSSGSNAQLSDQLLPPNGSIGMGKQVDHGSMYNGQIWFEPSLGGFARPNTGRRASSAPSGGSLDSALHNVIGGDTWNKKMSGARNASGQFFPNTLGYMENLAAIDAKYYARMRTDDESSARFRPSLKMTSRHQRRRKVAPMEVDPMQQQAGESRRQSILSGSGEDNHAFEGDLEAGESGRRRSNRHMRAGKSCRSESTCSSSESSASGESVVLDSDQELLGFDSTGTPIIATHTRVAPAKPLVIEIESESRAANDRGRVEDSMKVDSAASQKSTAEQQMATPEVDVSRSGKSRFGTISEDPEKDTSKKEATEEKQEPESRVESEAQTTGDTKKPLARQQKVTTQRRISGSEFSRANSQNELMGELSERLARRQLSADAQMSKVPEVEGNSNGYTGILNTANGSLGDKVKLEDRPVKSAGSSSVESSSDSNKTPLSSELVATSRADTRQLRDTKNGELLERQSIFALTYSGLATDKLPNC